MQALGSVYWPTEFGYLTSSPGNLFLLTAVLFSINVGDVDKATIAAWFLIISGMLASIISLIKIGLNDLYIWKMQSLFVLNILWLSPVLCLKIIDKQQLLIAVKIALAICLIGYILSDLFPGTIPVAVRNIIFTENMVQYWDTRVRGFMSETSHFAWIVGRFGFVAILLSESSRDKNVKRYVLSLLCVAILLLIIRSKGATFGVAIALLPLAFTKKTFLYSAFLIPVGIFGFYLETDSVVSDLESRTSTSTRVGLFLASIKSFLQSPFGCGYYGFYEAIRESGTWAQSLINQFGWDISEISRMVDAFDSVSYKSTIGDTLALNGVFYLVFMIVVLNRLNLSDVRVRSSIVFFGLSALSTSGNESISFYLGIAVLLKYYSKFNSRYQASFIHRK
jgi:hypothetical protein